MIIKYKNIKFVLYQEGYRKFIVFCDLFIAIVSVDRIRGVPR